MATAQEQYEKHHELLSRALTAIDSREYWSPFPEVPSKSIYGADAAVDGETAFRAYLNSDFPLDQPGSTGRVAPTCS